MKHFARFFVDDVVVWVRGQIGDHRAVDTYLERRCDICSVVAADSAWLAIWPGQAESAERRRERFVGVAARRLAQPFTCGRCLAQAADTCCHACCRAL